MPLNEEMEDHLPVALEAPVWRRQLEPLLKCSFALAHTDVVVGVGLGKSVGRLEGHTSWPQRHCTDLPVKLRHPLVALERATGGDILAIQRDQNFCVGEPAIPLGLMWVVHLEQFGGALNFLQSCMSFSSRADVPRNVLLGPG